MLEAIAITACVAAGYFSGFLAGLSRRRQTMRVTGASNIAIQSGCHTAGHMAGGDLIINGKRETASRCQHCGASQ